MRIGIPKEIHTGEKRVAATPETVGQLAKLGYSVAIEAGAGQGAQFADDAYRAAGAEIVTDTRALWSQAQIVLKVRAPEQQPGLGVHEAELLREGAVLLSFIWPAQNPELMERLKTRRVTVIGCAAHAVVVETVQRDTHRASAICGGQDEVCNDAFVLPIRIVFDDRALVAQRRVEMRAFQPERGAEESTYGREPTGIALPDSERSSGTHPSAKET